MDILYSLIIDCSIIGTPCLSRCGGGLAVVFGNKQGDKGSCKLMNCVFTFDFQMIKVGVF